MKLEDADYDDAASTGSIPVFTASDMDIDRDVKDRLETQEIFAIDFGGEFFRNNTTIDWSLAYVHAEEEEPNRLDTDFRYTFEDGEVFGVNVSNPLRPQLIYQGGVTTDTVFNSANYENNGIELTNGLAQDREYSATVNLRHDFQLRRFLVLHPVRRPLPLA